MPTPTELTWQSLTGVLQELRTPNSFVSRMMFPNHHTNPTQTINVDSWIGGRIMAPFVMPGASALMVKGRSKKFSTIEAPNIRIKRPFTAQERLFARTPGTPVIISASQQLSEVNQAIEGDVRYMREQIDDTIEWMCCQALTGVVTYNIATATGQPGASFTIDFGRPGAHTITLLTTDRWSEPTATATKPIFQLILEIKALMNNAGGFNPTDCIMGTTAALAFLKNAQAKGDLQVPGSYVQGNVDLRQFFNAQGALFLGEFNGVRMWQYGRTVLDPYGSAVNLITPAQVHFVDLSGAGDNVLEFGGIADFDAMEGGQMQAEVFAKSWKEQDPSGYMYLATSRPFPVTRRPESVVSVTVI